MVTHAVTGRWEIKNGKEELYNILMVNIWQNRQGLGIRIICQKKADRGKGVDRPTKIDRMKDKKSLSAWWEMKKEWGGE